MRTQDLIHLEKESLVELLKTNQQKLSQTRQKLSSARQRIRKMKDIIQYQRHRIIETAGEGFIR